MLHEFVRAENGRLWEGDREFRFFGLAAPNLHQNESQPKPDWSNRFPDAYEVRDVLESLQQIGCTATRTFGLSIQGEDPMPAYLTGPGKLNEEAFWTYDRIFAEAHRTGVRIIFPFIDSHTFYGWRGVDEFAAWRGKPGTAFWTDPQLKADFVLLMEAVLNRRNTLTGVLYKEDPAVLAWQLGNELDSYHADRGLDGAAGHRELTEWSLEMAGELRRMAPNHLVMEAGGNREAYLGCPDIDLLSDHYYEYWSKLAGRPFDLAAQHRDSMAQIGGRKPLIADEFGLGETSNLSALMDAIIESGCSGGLLWSVRGHRRDGGFYCHNEGGTNVHSYHWPGFSVGEAHEERGMLDLLRKRAFEIREMDVPAVPAPTCPPVLLEARHGGLIWRGSTGASHYRFERRSASGEWNTVADRVEDASVVDVTPYEESGDWHPQVLFRDLHWTPETEYRVVGCNSSGETAPSNSARAGEWR